MLLSVTMTIYVYCLNWYLYVVAKERDPLLILVDHSSKNKRFVGR